MKRQSLGSNSAAATAGILCTGGTNATPIVATLNANNGLKTGDRIRIQGVTGLTAMNGTWSVEWVSDTTVKLLGSVGNGAFGGTAVVGVAMDKTPFMEDHAAAAHVGNVSGAAVFVGTAIIEGCNEDTLTTWVNAVTKHYGLASEGQHQSDFVASTAGIDSFMEVRMHLYMRYRNAAWTSGGAKCELLA